MDSGTLARDWGAGNFIALKFTPGANATKVKVGLDPSQGSGLVYLDEDLNGVFKVTDKKHQLFKVVSEDAHGRTYTQAFDLSGLTCEGPSA